jgi:hypothetical protein
MLLGGSVFAQQRVPEISFTSVPDYPTLPAGNELRRGSGRGRELARPRVRLLALEQRERPAFGAAAAQLFEFDQNGNFVREIGKGLYAWSEAHSVRIDRNDNIWAIDKGSNMVVRFNPQGRVVWVFGRKQEAADGAEPLGHPDPPLPPVDGNFRQPTDVAWDSQGNTYITDGYINSRVAKFDKNGDWVKSWGSKGTGPWPIRHPAFDCHRPARQHLRWRSHEPSHPGVRHRWQLQAHVLHRCTTRSHVPPRQRSDTHRRTSQAGDRSTQFTLHDARAHSGALRWESTYPGRIFKVALDGTVLGVIGRSGRNLGQFSGAHALACPTERELYVGETSNWRIQKLTLR